MKKITSLLIIFVFVMQFAVAFADTNTQVADASAERKIFSALGMTSSDIDKLSDKDSISRGQYAYVLAGIMGYKEGTKTDVPIDCQGSAYGEAIGYLIGLGVFSTGADGRFYPEDKLLFDAMLDSAIKALGYRDYAATLSKNTATANLLVANRIDILKGISDKSTYVSVGTAFTFLKKIALTSVLESDKIINNSIRYSNNPSSSLLYTYAGISYVEGKMTDNGITSLTGVSNHKGSVTVGDVTMRCDSVVSNAQLIGRYVEAFYILDGTEKLLYVDAVPKRNKIVTIDASQLEKDNGSFTTENIVYSTGKDTEELQLSPNVDVIYNGIAVPLYSLSDLKIRQGTICATSVNSNSKYDVVYITEYEDYTVNGANEGTLYLRGGRIDKEDYGTLVVRVDNRVSNNFSPVTAGNVVSLIVSKKNEYAEVIVSTKTVKGPVSLIGQDELGREVYEIDSVKYAISESMLDEVNAGVPGVVLPELSRYYTAMLNFQDRIVTLTRLYDDMWQTAYCVGVAKDKGSLNTDVKLKLVMTDGKVLLPYFTKKVNVNGTRVDVMNIINGAEKAYFFSDDGNPIRQPVHIRFNQDGEVAEIETPVESTSPYGYDNSKFTKDAHLDTGIYRGKNHRGIANYSFAATSFVIQDPYKSKPETCSTEKVVVKSIPSISDGTMSNCDIYNLDESYTAEILVYEDNEPSMGDSTTLFMVDKVSTVLDDEGEEIKKVYGYTNNDDKYYTYVENEAGIIPINAKAGDIYKINANGNTLFGLESIIKLADNPEPAVSGDAVVNGKWVNIFGYVYAVKSTSITIFKPDSYDGTDKKLIGTSMNGGDEIVLIYDRATKTVSTGTWEDVAVTDIPDANGDVTFTAESPMAYIYRRYDRVYGMALLK